MPPEKDEATYLWDMLSAAREAQDVLGARSLEEFKADIKTLRASERCIEIIEEAARRLWRSSQAFHEENAGPGGADERNVLAFRHGEMDPEALYKTVREGLPRLIESLEGALENPRVSGVEVGSSRGARSDDLPPVEGFEALWESIVADPGVSPLTPEQKAELDRCLEAYERDGDPGRPMEEVLEEIEEMLRRR